MVLSARKPQDPAIRHEPRTWGEHLRRQRILRGVSQPNVANEIGICVKTLIAWEHHQRIPPVRFVPRIICFLGYCPWQAPTGPGDRFRQVRMALGFTHKAAAGLLGVDPATVTRWELGQRRPVAGTRERLLAVILAAL